MSDQELADRIAQGRYAKKQIHCKSWIVSWSHRSRFDAARSMVAPYAGQRLLDYGCGDGTFLAQVSDLFPNATGADIDVQQTAEAAERLGGIASLRFCPISELLSQVTEPFDLITCMETLEHVSEQDMPGVIDNLRKFTKDEGRLIVSVPIEVGPTLVGKQVVRRIAGWRNLGHYKYTDKYTFGELFKMTFAGRHSSIERGVMRLDLPDGTHVKTYSHKGFNWRALRDQLATKFAIVDEQFTPLGWTRGLLSSQVWLTCKPA